jgi:cytochrome c oxidase subunit 2
VSAPHEITADDRVMVGDRSPAFRGVAPLTVGLRDASYWDDGKKPMIRVCRIALFGTALMMAFAALAGGAFAAEPTPWGLGLQDSATPIMRQVEGFHSLLLVIIVAITLFVLALMLFVMVRFRASANPTPSKTTHNTIIEIVWTTVPVILLVIIAIPSFKLLYAQDTTPDADLTLKAIGHQWYWSYEYQHPEKGTFTFDSFMLSKEDAKDEGLPPLLAADTAAVVPVGTNIRVLVTASDVIHAFAVPAFGVKIDAVPGRLNETWVNVEKEGVYYGQCSELCGTNHAYMPIMIKAVSEEEYAAWLDEAYDEFAAVDQPSRAVQLADSRSAQ